MNRFVKFQLIVLTMAFTAGAACAAEEVMSDQQKRSYAIGANVGNNLRQQGLDFDPEQVSKGLVEAMTGKAQLTDEEIATIVKQLHGEAKQRQEAERKKLAEENQRRGAAFRSDYAKREGVKTLPGGILYRVLQAGAGERPTGAEYVMCNYRGTLVDGTQFDASPPGKPATFNLTKIIAGWRDALPEMPVGSRWELVIPAEKAYGVRGRAPAIGPNETLIFEVELVGFE